MPKEFAVIVHGYQPGRKWGVELPIGGRVHEAHFSVAPEYDGIITDQVYGRILRELPSLPGLFTSIYAPLRSYFKREQPELYTQIVEAVAKTPDKEYKVFGDPLIHTILPLLSPEDQEMLVVAGKRAFEQDFGFSPKGMWLPETAVSKDTLKILARNGYEFVPLRDYQVKPDIERSDINEQHSIYTIDLGDGDEISTVVGNSTLSGWVGYDDSASADGATFLERIQRGDFESGWNPFVITDLETFGHHKKFADQFLKWVLEHQGSYNFEPLDLKRRLTGGSEKRYAQVYDGSSWSCAHNLGRWTGDCYCENASQQAKDDRKYLHTTLKDMNEMVNAKLNKAYPGWRTHFTDVLVEMRDDIFTGANFAPSLASEVYRRGGDEEYLKLFLAKIEILIGTTSCGWFFDDINTPERDIPANMIKAIQDLFPEGLAATP